MSIRRQVQLEGHCGPTCISMLLDEIGFEASQQEIASAAGVTNTIQKSGSRIDQLSSAVSRLFPELIVVGQYGCNVGTVSRVLSERGTSVGVEWQGRFFFPDSTLHFEVGHYSIITSINEESGAIKLVDPDELSVFSSGSIQIPNFESRWWEDNELYPGQKFRSFGLAFCVCRKSEDHKFREYGFEHIDFNYSLRASKPL